MSSATLLPTANARVLFDAAEPRRLDRALYDLSFGCSRWRLAMALAWLDLRNRYRGSVLGPFWLTISTAVMLVSLGWLYAALFKLEVQNYLPWLAASLIIWNVISQLVVEACTTLTGAEGIIRQLPLPFTVHALRCVFRNALVAAHNLPLILIVFLIFGRMPGLEAFQALPGLLLLAVDGFAAALFLGMLCARFRDINPIVGSVLQIVFFITPVIWQPQLLSSHQGVLMLNPFYVVMETIRQPLLDGGVGWGIWAVALGYSAALWAVAFLFFMRFRARIAFWV